MDYFLFLVIFPLGKCLKGLICRRSFAVKYSYRMWMLFCWRLDAKVQLQPQLWKAKTGIFLTAVDGAEQPGEDIVSPVVVISFFTC